MNKAELIKALAELLAEKMELGEEPTNGEVLQAVFPNCVVSIDEYGWRTMNIDGYVEFTPEWWNEPYKAEKPENCKGCLEPCIMYEPDMRACKKKVTKRGE